MKVAQQSRVAWEGARVFVAATEADAYWWLSDMMARHLGVIYHLKLAETRLRVLQSGETVYAEAGAWRVRLEELLKERPELTPVVVRLIVQTAERIPR